MLFMQRQAGQGLAEYALILALVAVVIIAILTLFGTQMGDVYSHIVGCLPDPGPLCPELVGP
jgi:pilus assembly protein Flp/PilA